MFEGGGPDQAVEDLALLLQHLEAPGHLQAGEAGQGEGGAPLGGVASRLPQHPGCA